MISALRLADPATVAELIELQRAAYRVEAQLIGAVGYRVEDGVVDVCRLVVHPAAFRRGVATALLDELDGHHPGAAGWSVSTASANRPARALYERRGFGSQRQSETPDGVRIVHYAR